MSRIAYRYSSTVLWVPGVFSDLTQALRQVCFFLQCAVRVRGLMTHLYQSGVAQFSQKQDISFLSQCDNIYLSINLQLHYVGDGRRQVICNRQYRCSVTHRGGVWILPILTQSNTYGSLNPHESAFKRHLTAHPCTQHTDTHTTLRATSVAIGRIYALRAGDEASKLTRTHQEMR